MNILNVIENTKTGIVSVMFEDESITEYFPETVPEDIETFMFYAECIETDKDSKLYIN